MALAGYERKHTQSELFYHFSMYPLNFSCQQLNATIFRHCCEFAEVSSKPVGQSSQDSYLVCYKPHVASSFFRYLCGFQTGLNSCTTQHFFVDLHTGGRPAGEAHQFVKKLLIFQGQFQVVSQTPGHNHPWHCLFQPSIPDVDIGTITAKANEFGLPVCSVFYYPLHLAIPQLSCLTVKKEVMHVYTFPSLE